MKKLAQVLSALIYTPFYTGVVYLAIVLPIGLLSTLSFWKMVIAYIVFCGLIHGIIALVQSFGLIPLGWIVKENKGALCAASVLCAILPALNIFSLWQSLLRQAATAGTAVAVVIIVVAVVITINLVLFAYSSITTLRSLYRED